MRNPQRGHSHLTDLTHLTHLTDLTHPMNTKDFLRLGVPLREAAKRATDFVAQFVLRGGDPTRLLGVWVHITSFGDNISPWRGV